MTRSQMLRVAIIGKEVVTPVTGGGARAPLEGWACPFPGGDCHEELGFPLATHPSVLISS